MWSLHGGPFLIRRLLGIQMGTGGGGLKESWVQRLQGFPEQGWRSCSDPCRQIIKSTHAALRLTLNIPEASGLVWVVDGQADSSDVLQSLCCTSEKVVLGG